MVGGGEWNVRRPSAFGGCIIHRPLCYAAGALPSVGVGRGVWAETLYHRDDALLYIAYVTLIWAAPIPADRWHCSLWP